MAPVKRSITTAQRETRATRAATVAKKTASVASKKSEALPIAKSKPASIRSTATTRKEQQVPDEDQFEPLESQEMEDVVTNNDTATKPTRSRTARVTAPAKGLAAAPRRRLKVTPLDAPMSESTTTKEPPKKTTTKAKSTSSTKSTRSKAVATETEPTITNDVQGEESEVKSTRKTASRSKDTTESKKSSAPKTRGRPKAQKVEEPEQSTVEPETIATKRTTRSQRAESIASSEAPAIASIEPASKPVSGTRKKVTFQDLPSENDKENQPLPQAKGKKAATTKVSESTTTATGLRAKPLRKTTTASSVTRGRKTASTPVSKSSKSSSENVGEKEAKKMPQALTPKKITQVAKSSSPEREDDASEGEDELNGGKTPVRDLSVSPRRPQSAALAKALSPAKKLDFGQSLVPKSPDRTAIFREIDTTQTGMLGSPARRPAASPFKDALKDSPKRGLNEAARLLFPNQPEGASSSILNAPSTNTASHSMSNMMQSPKRVGTLDPSFFSQSAMKKSTSNVSKSPFKSSLFGTPAKRLFSPAKKSATSFMQNTTEAKTDEHVVQQDTEMELESEVSASSHFRSSSSPLRVMRMNANAMDMDFDDSIMQVGSPFRVQKSPMKALLELDLNIVESAANDSGPQSGTKQDVSNIAIVEPSDLELARASMPEASGESKDQPQDASMEDDAGTENAHEELSESVPPSKLAPTQKHDENRRSSLSQVLFRSARAVSDEEESSEDELAGEQTPARQIRSRSRLSRGVPQSVTGKGFGFTPLAAQMSGWLASSPEKSPEHALKVDSRRESGKFSPLARQHIDGEVTISRDSTPVQKLRTRKSIQPVSSSKLNASSRKSLNLRKSLAQRQSMGLFESPARNPQFEEYMEIRALEEQASAENPHEQYDIVPDMEFDHVMDVDGGNVEEEGDDTILENEEDSGDDREVVASELTTDLINFTHASDTAMVDFRKLAEEAEELASEGAETTIPDTVSTEAVLAETEEDKIAQDAITEDDDMESATEEPELAPSSPMQQDEVVLPEEVLCEVQSPLLQPVNEQLDSPSMLVIDRSDSPLASPSPSVQSATTSPARSVITRTPQPNLRLNEQRVINTVVSKIPLKPEGAVSPIKITKKRSRSFGNSDASPPKRISFGSLKSLPVPSAVDDVESPDRRTRTSVAPSPGGTSTPATNKSDMTRASRYSLGAVTTPGQMSFAIDDFGDSTLDGIEFPEDFDETEMTEDLETPVRPVRSGTATSAAVTPMADLDATPATARRSARRTTTPATVTKKTPKTTQKTPARASTNTTVERTPLGPVGKGILHGATVFVDVHTSEGADASGIFIELLSQMGAKCVKEWRWNSRASLAPQAENDLPESKVGITHVVFKDGGKRTLEKVRDAKGEVCCVGVAWVLDCERENKWLDESTYAIDTSILPRGGSKRRKSMEPRALLVSNGSVSASRPRRSVSAEMSELMKRELIKTPARVQTPTSDHDDDDEDEDNEDVQAATPTGFVSYDPRTAMTPGTPYLISQGKQLTQMSAPPKQHNKSLFDDEDEENQENVDESLIAGERGNAAGVKDAKKFRMKNLGDIAKRRRTLGFQPVVGSPLGRN